ncbi:MAG TPA: type II toxin-antitoxin system VapC family toxin [bacterium]|nr:type II toxin-antitoxin system VapC family toxin [bacterium]
MNAGTSGTGAISAVAYLDTSALVSLYVEDRYTDRVRRAVQEVPSAATARIAYVEARAVFARMRRERLLRPRAYAAIVALFNDGWERLNLVEITAPLVQAAADLVERHPLRGFDALHLASALVLRGDDVPVTFCCHESRLAGAARAAGFEVVP